MSSLPAEIIEIIFSFCDGDTLYSAAISCDFLRNLVILNPSEQILMAWRQACLKEIPSDYFIDILESFNPKYFFAPEDVDWIAVYTLWYDWRHVNCWLYNKKESCHSKVAHSIQTSSISGKWLIFAIKDCLYAVDINTKITKLIFKDTHILSFNLACDTSPDCVDLEGGWLPGIEHDKVAITLDRNVDAVLNLRSGAVKYLNNIGRTKDILYFQNNVIHLRRQEGPPMVEVIFDDIFKPNQKCVLYFSDEGPVGLLDVWKSEVLFHQKETFVLYNSYSDAYKIYNGSTFVPESNLNKNIMSRYCRLFIKIENTQLADNLLYLMVDQVSAVHQIYQNLRISVSCVTFRAGILLLGSEQGCILGYKVDELKDVLNIDFTKYAWKYDLKENCGKICHILKIEVQFKTVPTLWVTTRHQVFRIPLLKKLL